MNLFTKIKNKIKHSLQKFLSIFKTYTKIWLKQSDRHRWQQSKSLFTSWDQRTQRLASHIPPNSTVFEFGAARLVLREMLAEGCTYLHSDLVARAEGTLVADLNKDLPEIPKVDYVVFSGVLEYLFEIEKVFLHLNSKTTCFLFSYATLDSFPNIAKRRENGWVSDLSVNDLEKIASKLGKNLVHFAAWKSQHLFKLE